MCSVALLLIPLCLLWAHTLTALAGVTLNVLSPLIPSAGQMLAPGLPVSSLAVTVRLTSAPWGGTPEGTVHLYVVIHWPTWSHSADVAAFAGHSLAPPSSPDASTHPLP